MRQQLATGLHWSPWDTAALGVGTARTRAAPRRNYLARSERVKLLTGTLALAHADPDQEGHGCAANMPLPTGMHPV
jgi:hypothetical protein